MKKKCVDCGKFFEATSEHQLRGDKCQMKHNFSTYKKVVTQIESESVSIKLIVAEDSKYSDILNSKSSNSEINFAEALVNPEYVKHLSTVLGREVKQEKADTRDYNNAFIRRLDMQALELMEGGLKDDILPGEGMKIKGFGDLSKGNDVLIQRLKRAIETQSYNSFPFSKEISDDIRVKFLLRTENTDTFESLFNDISNNRKDIIGDEDWSTLQSSMLASQKRLELERVMFLSPLDEGITGQVKKLSKSESDRFGLNDATVDIRQDSHDLVSLRELAAALKGEQVDQLSPFAGSFSKYMPELNNAGVRGVVFVVEAGQLKSIKLSKLNGKEIVPFGPVDAAISVSDLGFEINSETTKIYVTVSGAVAAPGTGEYSYLNKMPLNENIVPSAETFLFNNFEGEILSTRIYFYPYKPSQLNPVYQTMSVVYGDSDQMFNSCAIDKKKEFFNEEVRKDFFEKISFYGYDDEPGVKAAKMHFMEELDGPEDLVSNEMPEYLDIGIKASDSLYGENKYTVDKYLAVAKNNPRFPNELSSKVVASNLLNKYHPLSARFIVYDYLDNNNGGLTKEANITTLSQIPRYNFNQILEDFKVDVKMNKLMEKTLEVQKKKNISMEAAMSEVMTPAERKEALKLIGKK